MTTIPNTYAESSNSNDCSSECDMTYFPSSDHESSSDEQTEPVYSQIKGHESLALASDINDHDAENNQGLIISNSADAEQDLVTIMDVLQSATVYNNDDEELMEVPEPAVNVTVTDHDNSKDRKLARKRKRNVGQWKKNVRQQLRQSGKAYVSMRGKLVTAKTVSGTCGATCKMKCNFNISDEARNDMFLAFYNLTADEKRMFIGSTTQRVATSRKTKKSEADEGTKSRRNNTYLFYLEVHGERTHVCKKFYLSTLAISQRQVYTVHDTKDPSTGIPTHSRAGKHVKHCIPQVQKDFVHEHIKSIPVIDSHYRRKESNKKYFEDHTLNIQKLYRLYLQWLPEGKIPVKESMYRDIFNHNYNYGFSQPKNDICDTCSLFDSKLKSSLVMESDEIEFEMHHHAKNFMRAERNRDRQNKDIGMVVICFDLENILTMPKCGVSSFFYKRKLTGFNLTAHAQLCIEDKVYKKYYSCVWTEAQAGRSGDVLASALIAIFKRVCKDFPQAQDFITWSDSCVPQNRNKMMAFAVQHFLQNQAIVKTVTMKYCTPGHSAIQEVDNLHSQIEKIKRRVEYYSPVSLLRSVLLKVNPNMTVMQMPANCFNEYSYLCSNLNYSAVPFSRVTMLQFDRSACIEIAYRCDFDEEIITATISRKRISSRKCADLSPFGHSVAGEFMRKLPTMKKPASLSAEKIKDLKSMMPFIPQQDQRYYETLF